MVVPFLVVYSSVSLFVCVVLMMPRWDVGQREVDFEDDYDIFDSDDYVVAPTGSLSLFGSSMCVNMSVLIRGTLIADTGALATASYRANACNGIDLASNSQQPQGFADLSQLFDRYTVLGSVIEALYLPTSHDLVSSLKTESGVVGINLSRSAVPVASIFNILRERYVAYTGMSPADAALPVNIIRRYSPRDFFSVSDPTNSDDLTSSVLLNPAREAFFQVFFGAVEFAADHGLVQVAAHITYTVLFTVPKEPVES